MTNGEEDNVLRLDWSRIEVSEMKNDAFDGWYREVERLHELRDQLIVERSRNGTSPETSERLSVEAEAAEAAAWLIACGYTRVSEALQSVHPDREDLSEIYVELAVLHPHDDQKRRLFAQLSERALNGEIQ